MIPPDTKFAQMGDINVAYQSFGSGPVDIVFVSNWVWAVDLIWDFSSGSGWLMEALGDTGRTIQFDMPGTGSSDPLPHSRLGTLEEWMETVAVVLDAEGSEKAVLIAQDIGGPMAMLFAAAHPERVSALILIGTTARLNDAPDYPIGFPSEMREQSIDWWERIWGTGNQLRLTAPTLADEENIRLMARYERLAVPRGSVRRVFSMIADLDVRHILESIHVPTLVLHRGGDLWIPPAHGQYIADKIPGARFVEVPGDDHMPWAGDIQRVIDEIRHFLGIAARTPSAAHDRVLATVLFTDIVSSTEKAADLGDRRWSELLDRHDSMVRNELDRWKGREVKTTGDGFLATFDGPGKALSAATAIRQGARLLGIDIRAGLHVGEVELRGEDIGGLAVHAAARIMSNADPGEILASSTVKDLVIGSDTRFDDRGAQSLKGVPGEWRLYAVAS